MKLVIIGNGVAGVTTARLIADRNSGNDLTIYASEPYPYYPRPRLIDLLAGKIGLDAMPLYPPEWYAQRGIRTLLEHQVVQLDPVHHKVSLDNGASQSYDRLVLAMGAHGFVPPITGANTEGVFTLRTLNDAQAILNRLEYVRHVVVLGGGLLGLDTAAALRTRGAQVSVVEMLPRLLPRQLDVEGASVLTQAIEKTGIQVITGDICSQMTGQPTVQQVHLKSGRVLEAEMVIISAGVRANIGLAHAAGLVCNKGVVVNERLQTSHPDIYAVGDVAEFNQTVWAIIPAALAQARVAAAQLLGETETLYQDIVPSTSLQVTGIDLTSMGEVNPEGRDGCVQVRHIDQDRGIYKKLTIHNGRVVGAISLGDRSDVRAMSQLISRGMDVTPHLDELLRENFDLAGLLR